MTVRYSEGMPNHPSFKDLPLWQHSMQLSTEICQLILQLPHTSKLIIGARIQEAALDIPVLLARGSKGGTTGLVRALAAANQSAAELETLIILAQNVYNDRTFIALHDKTLELQTAISAMGRRVSSARTPQDV